MVRAQVEPDPPAIHTSGDIRAIQPNFRRPYQCFFGYPPIAVPKLNRIPLPADRSLDQLIRIRIDIITAVTPIRIRINIKMAIMPFLLFACPPVAVLATLNPIPDMFYCGLRPIK